MPLSKSPHIKLQAAFDFLPPLLAFALCHDCSLTCLHCLTFSNDGIIAHSSNVAKPYNLLLWLLSLSDRVREKKAKPKEETAMGITFSV